MTHEKPISPFLAKTLYSNGDSSSDDDDVFLNSRLDVMSRNCDRIDDQFPAFHNTSDRGFLNFKMDDHSISTLFTPSPKGENAVIFSVYFCGKYYGEVGLFEPDISVLDWLGFKAYIFSSLNLESFDSYIISYCDEDGDKLPIESEEDYQEALKIAKYKANEEEKFFLYITRIGGGFPNSLRSLVSSSLRRVNSVGGSKTSIASSQPLKKDVTTSTSFQSFGKRNSHSIELNSNDVSPSWVVPAPPPHTEELNSPQENYFGETHPPYDKIFYECAAHPHKETIPRSYSAYQPMRIANWNKSMTTTQDSDNAVTVPLWFSSYMKQFKEDLSLEVSSKIEERFDEAVGNLSATDVETKLRGLLTGYSSELQNKVLCCCRSPSGHCHKTAPSQSSPVRTSMSQQETVDALSIDRGSLVTPLSALRFDHRDDSLDGEGPNNQDYFLQKLLKREQEILDFLDNTNEKIKQKIKVNNDYTDSLRNCLTKELAIEERERVLARIEDFRQRQSRTTNDIKMLQQSMEVNNEGIARLALQDFVPAKDFDAKFIKDESFVDGSKVEPNQQFIKHWAVQNTGLKPWNNETFLVCQSYHQMKPLKQSISCNPLLPGEIGIVSAGFTAPSTPGIFSTEWRFIQRDKLFGNHLWCTIIVPATTEIVPDKVSPSAISVPDDVLSVALSVPEDVLPGTISVPDDVLSGAISVPDDVLSGAISVPDDVLSGAISVPNNALPLQPEEAESTAPVGEVPCLEELVRRKLFTDRSDVVTPPVDYLPVKFDKGSIEYFSYISKESLYQMSSEDILYYLMYIIRITKPDFTTLIDRLPLKFLIKSLSRGTDKDYDNLSLFLDKNFVEKCNRDNFKVTEMEECYKELFLTPKECDNILELTRKLQERYLHNSFNYSVDNSSDDDVKEDTINGRETAPLVEEYYTEDTTGPPAEVIPVTNGPDVKYESKQHSEEEYDNFDELLNGEDIEHISVGERESDVEEALIVVASGVRSPSLVISELNHELATSVNEVIDLDLPEESEDEHDGKVMRNLQGMESVEDTEDVKKSDIIPEKENFYKVNEDDCEDECSSIYSEYSDSESSLESEDEEENVQKEKPIESDIEVNSNVEEDHISCEEEEEEVEEEEEDEEEEEVGADGRTFSEEDYMKKVVGCSSSYLNSGDSRPDKEPKTGVTTLREHFKQNVEVRLDFEVIRQPAPEPSYRETNYSAQADALTFQEKHFTMSSRPPPEPMHVPESDDESFDGLVFIKDTDIPSSVPPTEPCSPSYPPRLSNPPILNEFERTMSCSSFSEVEDEDPEDPEEVAAGGDRLSDTAESSIHESVSTDVCSESSSSPIMNETSSIYYEPSLAENVLEQFYSIRSSSDDKKEDGCLKSPDTNADSGSSTSHTLKDVAASESSGSYDVNEAPLVDLAQEESTSEFEYVANVDN